MQVFIIGSALETAQKLDKKRLKKQIIECQQILDAISGEGKGWFNHPIVKMYEGHEKWLRMYMLVLQGWKEEKSDLLMLMHFNRYCEEHKPPFQTQEYFDQMKRRLYTKDSEYYSEWKDLGQSDVNWYFVDGEWKYYKNGKLITEKQ